MTVVHKDVLKELNKFPSCNVKQSLSCFLEQEHKFFVSFAEITYCCMRFAFELERKLTRSSSFTLFLSKQWKTESNKRSVRTERNHHKNKVCVQWFSTLSVETSLGLGANNKRCERIEN